MYTEEEKVKKIRRRLLHTPHHALQTQIALIEGAIFEKLAIILQKDVVEFMPYVFQIFAQMLELRQDLPESYSQLVCNHTLCYDPFPLTHHHHTAPPPRQPYTV